MISDFVAHAQLFSALHFICMLETLHYIVVVDYVVFHSAQLLI